VPLLGDDRDLAYLGQERLGELVDLGRGRTSPREDAEVHAHLERGLENLGARIEADLGVKVIDAPGAGAAGGVGAMLLGMGAEIRSGAEVVLDAIELPGRIKGADLVVTGEGRLDASTLAGKGPAAVAALAREAEVPCVALVGEAVEKPDEFDEVRSLAEHFGSIEEAKTRAAPGLQALAARVASDWR